MKFRSIRNLAIAVVSFLSLGCVPKSEYEQLKADYEELQSKLYYIEEAQRQAEIERNSIPYITEQQALEYIKDRFSFYEKDKVYRNVELRRIADNSFQVSLETCINKADFKRDNFFWKHENRKLIVYNDGSYELKWF